MAFIPRVIAEDLVPPCESDTVDFEIWYNQLMDIVEEEQPVLYEYWVRALEKYGGHAACVGLFTFHAILKSLERNQYETGY
ncbi:MAG: hypothetical protein WC942_04895 [Clostridia bacterium]|jgi:hypothetical protein